MTGRLAIGIDPGVNTGFAVWDRRDRKLVYVATLKIHQAMLYISNITEAFEVRFEDARQRRWFGKMDAEQAKYGAAVREGAGAAKRDAKIWEDFLIDYKIPFQAMKPAAHMTKWSKVYLKQISGYDGPSSEHARDAAALVVGL